MRADLPGNNVGNFRDLHDYWVSSSISAGVEGSSAGLAVWDVSGTEEVRELGYEVVSVVGAEETCQE